MTDRRRNDDDDDDDDNDVESQDVAVKATAEVKRRRADANGRFSSGRMEGRTQGDEDTGWLGTQGGRGRGRTREQTKLRQTESAD